MAHHFRPFFAISTTNASNLTSPPRKESVYIASCLFRRCDAAAHLQYQPFLGQLGEVFHLAGILVNFDTFEGFILREDGLKADRRPVLMDTLDGSQNGEGRF